MCKCMRAFGDGKSHDDKHAQRSEYESRLSAGMH